MIENNHFLTRTLLVFPLLRLFLQQEAFTSLRYFIVELNMITLLELLFRYGSE